ncbi:MAG: mycofactocin system FadH/OYE family oxidoreductase 2, partial [Thermoplasmata archaeon]
MATKYPKLFSPLKIRNVTVKNRIAVMAHTTGYAYDHLINDRHVAYYEERAKGGAGLIILETQIIHPTAQPVPGESYGWEERNVPRYEKLAKAVHQHGAKIFGQIGHGGRNLADGGVSRLPIWGISTIPVSPVGEIPHIMDEGELAEVQRCYVRAASHLKAGGFDGVELHATHGYLFQQFWSLVTNNRTDRYGAGSLDDRLRFTLEVIDKVRAEIGNDIVLGMRMCGDEFFPMGGLTLDDTKEIAKRLEATGKLDYLSVSGGFGQTPFLIVADGTFPRGVHVHLAAGIKEVVKSIPVIASQRIVDPQQAEEVLAAGQADLIGMTRATIADPELPKKAEEGRIDEIRVCIACNQLCAANSFAGRPILCVVNPDAGYEAEFGLGSVKKAKKQKRVLVVG